MNNTRVESEHSTLLTINRKMQRQLSSSIDSPLGNQRTSVQRAINASEPVQEAGGYTAGASAAPLIKHL